jgi:hypothetical protein
MPGLMSLPPGQSGRRRRPILSKTKRAPQSKRLMQPMQRRRPTARRIPKRFGPTRTKQLLTKPRKPIPKRRRMPKTLTSLRLSTPEERPCTKMLRKTGTDNLPQHLLPRSRPSPLPSLPDTFPRKAKSTLLMAARKLRSPGFTKTAHSTATPCRFKSGQERGKPLEPRRQWRAQVARTGNTERPRSTGQATVDECATGEWEP